MAKPKLVGMNHVALEVGDIEEALAFYGRIFDFTLRGKGKTNAFIDMGDQFINLTQVSMRHIATVPRHFGLVVDDRSAVRELVEEAGGELLDGPFLDFLDPWGNRIEVVAVQRHPVHQGAARAARHGPGAGQDRQGATRTGGEGHGAGAGLAIRKDQRPHVHAAAVRAHHLPLRHRAQPHRRGADVPVFRRPTGSATTGTCSISARGRWAAPASCSPKRRHVSAIGRITPSLPRACGTRSIRRC